MMTRSWGRSREYSAVPFQGAQLRSDRGQDFPSTSLRPTLGCARRAGTGGDAGTAEAVDRPFVHVTGDYRDQVGTGRDPRGDAGATCKIAGIAYTGSNPVPATPASRARTGQRPNVLLPMADQFRWDAIGAHGDMPIRTPNLDRLAASGVSFRRAYTEAPVCVPARATLLTGRLAHRNNVFDNGQGLAQRNARCLQVEQRLRTRGRRAPGTARRLPSTARRSHVSRSAQSTRRRTRRRSRPAPAGRRACRRARGTRPARPA